VASRFGEGVAIAVWGLVCCAWVAVIWGWEPAYLAMTVDDSFYYTSTALNIGEGHGPTFDRINPTNGYHPLWLAVLVPLTRVTGRHAPLMMRTVLSLQVVLLFAGALLVTGPKVGGGRGLLGVAALALCNFYVLKITVNGQEAALQYLLLCSATAYWWRLLGQERQIRATEMGMLGALLGLLMLSRLEAGVVGVTILGLSWVRGASSGSAWRVPRKAVLVGAGAFILAVAPYFVWNLCAFGHLTPVSGAIKAADPGNAPMWARTSVAILGAALLAAMAFVVVRSPGDAVCRSRLVRLAPLIVYVCVQTVHMVSMQGRVIPALWYLVPHLLLFGLLLEWVWQIWQRSLWRQIVTVSAIASFALLSLATWAIRLNPETYAPEMAARRAGRWLARNAAQEAIVAGWDCGIVAAHSDRRVVNLDGLINSWEYKEQYLDRGRAAEYAERVCKADYIAQYIWTRSAPGKLAGLDGQAWFVAWDEVGAFRPIIAPCKRRDFAFLVLSRKPRGPTLDEYIRNMQRDEAPAQLTGPPG